MVVRMASLACLMGVAVFCIGCQTAPLGGSMWNVIEIVEPDEEDRAEIANHQAMLVAFGRDGGLTTTVIRTDGTVELEDRQRYRIDDDVITITHPNYELKAMYRFEEQQLRLHSEQFVILMDPIRRVGEDSASNRKDRPAMTPYEPKLRRVHEGGSR